MVSTTSATSLAESLDYFFQGVTHRLDRTAKIAPLSVRDWRALGTALATLPGNAVSADIRNRYVGERIWDLINGSNRAQLAAILRPLEVLPAYTPTAVQEQTSLYPYLQKAIELLNPNQERDEPKLQETRRKIIQLILDKTKILYGVDSLAPLIKLAINRLDLETVKALLAKADGCQAGHTIAQGLYQYPKFQVV